MTIKINKIINMLSMEIMKFIMPNFVFKGFAYKFIIEKKQNLKNIYWRNTNITNSFSIFLKNRILSNRSSKFIYFFDLEFYFL